MSRDPRKMSDAELETEVTDLRKGERALRRYKTSDRYRQICLRISELALEQGRREREMEGLE